MLSPKCIEQCVREIGQAELIWHDHRVLSEINAPVHDDIPILQYLHLTEEEVQSKYFNALELWDKQERFEGFSWAWGGMFRVSFLGDLRFLPQVFFEDSHFGTLLFAKAKRIKICTFEGYIYRYRHHSIRTFDDVFERRKQPPYFLDVYYAFEEVKDILFYRWSYSYTLICLDIVRSLHSFESKMESKLQTMLRSCAYYGFEALLLPSDPKHIREILKPLEPYMQKVSLKAKLAYHAPRIFALLRWVKQSIKKIMR